MWRFAAAAGFLWGLALLTSCGGRSTSPSRRPSTDVGAASQGVHTGKDRTGATDSLPSSALNEQHAQDIAELLQSRVPGLRVIRLPDGELSLRIRGGDMSLQSGGNDQVTAEASGEPLLVIDGMPVSEGQLSNTLRALDPRQVAKVQVLKDVSTTSAYGMRGAHGVIVITLKRD